MIEIVNADCVQYLKELPPDSIDLVVTSPPYNCGMPYRTYCDSRPWEEYLSWCRDWLSLLYRVCRHGGRIAVNVLFEMGLAKNSVRVFPVKEFSDLIQHAGFTVYGIPLWADAHKGRLTAWGSWRSASCPYIYNPCEVVIIACKGERKKPVKGIDTISREDFIHGCSGIWHIHPDTSSLTLASFPVALPKLAIELLSFHNELVLDPFCGSGTTGIACLQTGRNFIGIEVDSEYCEIARTRIAQAQKRLNNDKETHEQRKYFHIQGNAGTHG